MFPTVSISATLSIPTYFVLITIACIIALFWTQKRALKLDLSVKHALDLCLICFVSGFLGGRLFHIFYESPEYYIENPLKVFYFWEGGFVYYGGFISALICCLIFIKRIEPNEWKKYFDLAAPILSLAYIIGRSACFLAGCCYGRACELPWAVNGLHPTQLYAVFSELLVLGLLLSIEKHSLALQYKKPEQALQDGDLFLFWTIGHSAGRIVMELFRDDFRGLIYYLSISTWISLAVLLTSLALLIRRHCRRSSVYQ